MSKATTLGIELEFTGMSREKARDLMAKHFGTKKVKAFTLYGMTSYEITDENGKVWKVVYDGSIKSSNGLENNRCELVSPILDTSDDKDLNQFLSIVNILNNNGAEVNESCGIHVHVGAKDMNSRSVKNLTNLFYSRQSDFFRRLEVGKGRSSYCKKLGYKHVKNINQMNFRNRYFLGKNIKKSWYGDAKTDDDKVDTRYHAINFHSMYEKGTVEFRLFNATLNTNKIKAYAELCKRMKEFSVEQALISHRDMRPVNNKEMTSDQFIEWMERLGIKNKSNQKALLNEKVISQNAEGLARRSQRIASNRQRVQSQWNTINQPTPQYQM